MSRIKKSNFYVVHIYTGILLNHKNKIMPFAATWVQLEISVLSEVRKRKTKKEKDKYHMVSLMRGI